MLIPRVIAMILFASFCRADELPTAVVGQPFDTVESCIQWKTNLCIDVVCQTSELLDCQAQCKKQKTKECYEAFGIYQ